MLKFVIHFIVYGCVQILIEPNPKLTTGWSLKERMIQNRNKFCKHVFNFIILFGNMINGLYIIYYYII